MLVPGLVALLLLALAVGGFTWRVRRRTQALPASLTTEDRPGSTGPTDASASSDLDADPWSS